MCLLPDCRALEMSLQYCGWTKSKRPYIQPTRMKRRLSHVSREFKCTHSWLIHLSKANPWTVDCLCLMGTLNTRYWFARRCVSLSDQQTHTVLWKGLSIRMWGIYFYLKSPHLWWFFFFFGGWMIMKNLSYVSGRELFLWWIVFQVWERRQKFCLWLSWKIIWNSEMKWTVWVL